MSRHRPLADYLRPETLDDIIGQQHLIGPGAPLRKMAEKNAFVSSILWGPPGSGKTTLARAMAKDAKATFASLNATSATVNDVRKVLKDAEIAGMSERKTIIWIDECLPYDTLVYCKLPDGAIVQKLIGDIVRNKIICDVLSVNLNADDYEWQPIESWSEVAHKEMVEIEIEDELGIKLLRCSSCHLVYTRNRGYIRAIDLVDGDEPMLCSDDKIQDLYDVNKSVQNM